MTRPADDSGQADTSDEDDPHVASSRAGKSDGRDGTYVGQTSPDDALDVGESGAEARGRQQD